jgi:ParB/RepB/Spo0J family partition protein
VERLKQIPIDQIIPDENNPRGEVDVNSPEFFELADSVAIHGILQAISVRKFEDKYKIIFGERRYRAALYSNLEEIPSIIRQLDDNAVLEIQLIENLQRKGIHPLKEAESFKKLLDTGKYDAGLVAAKLGKNLNYVYQRIKLNDLIEEAKTALLENKIFLGHALILARHEPVQQKPLLKFLMNTYNGSQKSITELKEHIESNYMLALQNVPWSLKDKQLTKAGSCVDCPKRTGYNEHLFPEYAEDDRCTDKACFSDKLTAFIYFEIEKHREKGEELYLLKSYSFNKALPQFEKDTLSEHTDFEVYDTGIHKPYKKLKKKGIYVDANQKAGQIVDIILDKDLPELKDKAVDNNELFPDSWEKLTEEKNKVEEYFTPIDEAAASEIYNTAITEVEEFENNELAIVASVFILNNYVTINTETMREQIIDAFELNITLDDVNKKSSQWFNIWYSELIKLNRVQLTQVIVRVLLLSQAEDDEYNFIVSKLGVDVNKIKSKYISGALELGRINVGETVRAAYQKKSEDVVMVMIFTRDFVDSFSTTIKLQLPYKEDEDAEENINREFILPKARTLKLAVLNALDNLNDELDAEDFNEAFIPAEVITAINHIKKETDKILEQYC